MSPLERFEHCDWRLVPHRLHHQLERYLVDGIRPKSLFLARVLANDLVGAVQIGSPLERARLIDLVTFLLTDAHEKSFGSRSHYHKWSEIGGWRGMRDATENTQSIYEPRGKLWKAGGGDDHD